MDARNERYVMQQLLFRGNSHFIPPQSFIITPKLLENFPYDKNVTFHIIFQGQYLPDGFDWDTLSRAYAPNRDENDPDSEEDRLFPKRARLSYSVCEQTHQFEGGGGGCGVHLSFSGLQRLVGTLVVLK